MILMLPTIAPALSGHSCLRSRLLRSYVQAMKSAFFAYLVLFFSLAAVAAEPKIESIGAFAGTAPDAVKSAIAETGYRVTGGDGKVLAEIWPTKVPAAEKKESSAALYPDFVVGAFYGVISFPNGTTDLRGQNIPAGTYALRYALLPGDGNHMGVSPNPDFFLLVPVDTDPGPSVKMAYPALIRASAKASGTAHPAAFGLSSPDARGVAVNQDQGHTIAFFPIKTSASTTSIGMILSGAAE